MIVYFYKQREHNMLVPYNYSLHCTTLLLRYMYTGVAFGRYAHFFLLLYIYSYNSMGTYGDLRWIEHIIR
jgi:hypothetical protein